MLYWIIIGILIAAIIAVILFTVSKLLKEKKEYNQFERRHRSEDSYDDDYDEDEDEEEDEYEPEPRRRPVKRQPERNTSSAKRRWKIVLEDVDQQDQYSFIFYDSLGIGRISASSDYDKFLSLPEDLRVSKVHCAIIRSGDKLYLRDEGSKNHTYLNGKPVSKPIVIQKEDVITVGETRLEVVRILRETR
ncbi:MAG: FHA domain-containing protein [[Ruminococcus] gnavus]|nr:FHA domain-containing protein [Mediterraneibacter gnavus]